LSHKGAGKDNDRRSRWRETLFMFRQLCVAVCPFVSLAQCLRQWADISAALAESKRERTRQTLRMYDLLEKELG
jgi:hypothetical protein